MAKGYEEQVDQLTQIINLVKDMSYSKNGTTLSSHNELNNLLDTLLSETKEGRKGSRERADNSQTKED